MVKYALSTALIIMLGAGILYAQSITASPLMDQSFRSALKSADSGGSSIEKSPPLLSNDSGKKGKKGSAFAKSLLVPGWGQLVSGKKTAGYAFLTTEVALISSLIGFQLYASWLEDDYMNYARQHAGVITDKDHDYYVDIGNWMNRREYNEQRLRDRQFDRLYTSAESDWSWDSDENRRWFKSVRLSSDRARQKSILVVGALLLNHLVAAIDAGRGEKSREKLSLSIESFDRIALNIRF